MKLKLKVRFEYWLYCWAWFLGRFFVIFGFFNGCKWGYLLLNWLDNHGFEMWDSFEEIKKKINTEEQNE